MIPHQITVSNFLSYGAAPQTISFEGYSLICLSGRNGHGKSALLDAMTWALWGQARKTVSTPKPDEGLIRLGAKSMMVIFEFYVGGKLYRVRRECLMRQGNKPYLTLDMSVYDEAAGQFHSVTDKTIRKSQEVVNRIVGLEYDTYVNSAYLRQGNANEFSQKAPKERKKILTAILGIDVYDTLQTRALERAREHTAQSVLLNELIAHDEAELEQYPALVAEQEQVAQAIQAQVAQLQQAEHVRAAAQQQVSALEARMQEHAHKQAVLGDEKKETIAARERWAGRAQEYRAARRQVLRLASLNDIMAQLHDARRKEQLQRQLQKERMTLAQKSMVIEKQLFAREQVIAREIAVAGQELAQKKHAMTVAFEQARSTEKQLRMQREQLLAERQALVGQQESAQRAMALAAAEMAEHAAFKARFEKRKTFYTTYFPRMRWLQQQRDELLHKVEMVHDESSSCPLCDQLLSAKRKQYLQEKLQKNASIVTHQYSRLVRVLEQLKKILMDDHAFLKKGEAVLQELHAAGNQHEVLSAREAHVQVRLLSVDDALAKTSEECGALQIRLQQMTEQVAAQELQAQQIAAQDALLIQYRAQLYECEQASASIAYSEAEHAALEQQIVLLDQQRSSIEEADKRRVELSEVRMQLTMDRRQLKERLAQVLQAEKELGLLGGHERMLQEMQATLEAAKAKSQAIAQQKDALLQRQGQLAATQKRLEERRGLLEQRRGEVAALLHKYDDCMTLAQAWSKNGIQALLIEQAIPEIEHEANALLGRLSNNQAQVFIESLRDLKRGGVRETLDIKIADVMGVRPYEMFSGGEAFRIDFALRIAISKLLARRAGAALQVLIIDEGFGSQDEEGLGRLMEALYAVQDDFAKIIVVTHLPSFKENFPVHFIVEKGPTGSVVTVEQRG